MAGAAGVTSRRLFAPQVFTTPWAYVDHVIVAAGSALPARAHDAIGEAYYVIAGRGSVSVSATSDVAAGQTAPVVTGDAIPVRLGETSQFRADGSEALELLVIGVARDLEAKNAFILANAPRRP
jgi:mannose-6-phosphate isomerase-like protein (cupin superfamily)